MNSIVKMDRIIYYLLLLYALVSSISIAVANIAISLATIVAIVRYSKEKISQDIDKWLLKAVGIFLLGVLLSVLFAYDHRLAFYRFGNEIYHMLPVFLTISFIKNKEQLIKIMVVMGISIGIADGYAIWQGLHGNYRAAAFCASPMTFSGYLIQMIPLLLIVGLQKRFISLQSKIYFISIGIISCAALVYNGTRGAWIAVVVTIFLYSLLQAQYNKKQVVVFWIVCLSVGMLVIDTPMIKERVNSITDSTYQSNTERILLWKSSWNMFLDHPLVGIGAGNFGAIYNPHYILPEAKEPDLGHAHNVFFQMLAETGMIGFSAFIYMFACILIAMWRRYWLNRQDTWALAAFLVTISLLIQGLTEYNFGSSAVSRMYWCILGLSYIGSRMHSAFSDENITNK